MYFLFKRLIDLFLGIIILILISPILLIISIAIKLDSKGPILFKQKRFKKDQQFFNILKFRTMRCDTPSDVPTHLLKDPMCYITRVGKFLRKTSLDELPQIFNIISGEMSFVGPRPALWNQTDLIELREERGANSVPVGLTGWAQINGRDELPLEKKADYDGEYSKKRSLWFDFLCFVGSFTAVLRRKGVLEGGTGVLTGMQESVKKHK